MTVARVARHLLLIVCGGERRARCSIACRRGRSARAGDQFVLAGDFHVHAFVGDGGVAPWELGREAARRGLDVIAVTNHNQLLAARLTRCGSPTDWADRV